MKYNLGCGTDIKKGYVNCDEKKLPGVDKVFDLESPPYPIPDESAEEIYPSHVLEHMRCDIPLLMDEFWRILKPGGKLIIKVPFYHGAGAWADPTHVRGFSYLTFDYFVKGHSLNYYSKNQYSSCKVKLDPTRLGKLIPPWPIFLRKKAGDIIGNVIAGLEFELVK